MSFPEVLGLLGVAPLANPAPVVVELGATLCVAAAGGAGVRVRRSRRGVGRSDIDSWASSGP